MPLTLGLTGMDPATETALKAAFTEANARLAGRWRLLPEAEAEHVMVDMDSMYGPMSWLRLHAAGKRVVGLTTATRTQTDFRLGRPFDSYSFSVLLRSIASEQGVELTDQAPTDSTASAAAEPAAATPAPAATTQTPAAPTAPTPAPAQQAPAPAATVAATPESDATPVSQPEPATPAPAADRDPVFADWLAPGALSQRVRYRRDNGPALLIDPVTRHYHGPATLKPLASCFEGVVRREDFDAVDDADWTRESTAAGATQPLLRLQWLGGLVAGKGALLPGFDPDGHYRLNKWPQTEREYPKHFRIATAMMKGPAPLADIATASGVPVADVADFVNANLATGYAEFVPESSPESAESPKPAGLFRRLRGR